VQRLWRLFGQFDASATGEDKAVERKVHQTVHAAAQDIEALGFNKAVARIYELTGVVEKAAPSASRNNGIKAVLLLIAPMMPHLAEEAWAKIEEGLVADAAWPAVDPALLVDDEVTVAVQVKGKLRDTVTVAKGTSRKSWKALRWRRKRCSVRSTGRDEEGDRGARPTGESGGLNLMKRFLALIAAPLLGGCGLHPMYEGGSHAAVSQGLDDVEVPAIAGQQGWLMRNALNDRMHPTGNREGTALSPRCAAG
jgi:leucyl-tRNA synthetase